MFFIALDILKPLLSIRFYAALLFFMLQLYFYALNIRRLYLYPWFVSAILLVYALSSEHTVFRVPRYSSIFHDSS